jgi:hypothetical protein
MTDFKLFDYGLRVANSFSNLFLADIIQRYQITTFHDETDKTLIFQSKEFSLAVHTCKGTECLKGKHICLTVIQNTFVIVVIGGWR